MANRFLNNITINDEYTLPGADGTADQIITTDGAGQLSFVDQSTINAGNAEHVVIYAKNTHTASIAKGTPVYITGTVGATDTVEIAPADASNSAKMPAVGLLDDTLAVNDFGYVITGGFMDNITTDPIDGATPSSNDTVYVKAGGGLTLTKPTGSNLIQNVAKVGKVSGGNSGSLIVSSILRTNDVPNLTTGKIWVGTASNTAESTVVHLDETNNRLGVNQTSPIGAVHILGPNTNPAMTTSALVVEQGDGAKILIDGNDIDAAAGMLYLNDYSTNDVVFGGQIRVGGGGSPVGNSWFANGNVGIGTTSPSQKLDVEGNIYTSGNIRIKDTGDQLEFTNASVALQRSGNFLELGGYDGIIFSSSNATLDNQSERMRITSTGNVGIGTTSPSGSLNIRSVSSTGSEYNLLSQNNSGTQLFYVRNDGVVVVSNNYFYVTSSQGAYFDGSVKARGGVTDDGGTLGLGGGGNTDHLNILTSGNVGIGTTSPTQKLHIDGTTSNTTGLVHTTTGLAIFRVATDNSDFALLGQGGSNRFDIYDNNAASTRFSINSSGNVGIGTTSPSQKLQVNGIGEFAGALRITETSTSQNILIGNQDGSGANTPAMINGVNGVLRFGKGNSWSGEGGTFTEAMRVNTSGNVGIGTTNPQAKLHITDSVSAVLKVQETSGNTGASAGVLFKTSPNTADSYFKGGILYEDTGAANVIGKLHLVNRISADTTNANVGDAKLTIDTSGNVGIGTTSPNATLDVNGAGNFSGGTVVSGIDSTQTGIAIPKGMYLKSNDGNYLRNIIGHTSSGNIEIGQAGTSLVGDILLRPGAAGNIRFFGTGSEDMRITSTGNVGIGTTSPAFKTTIYSDSNTDSFPLVVGQPNNANEFVGIGLSGFVASNGAVKAGFVLDRKNTYGVGDIHILNNTTTDNSNATLADSKFTILQNGNVGIGTTSPNARLHVYNTGNGEIEVERASGALVNIQAQSAKGLIGTDSNHTFSLKTNSSERLTILTSGNVGIGTTSPSQKLHVAGNGLVTGTFYLGDTNCAMFRYYNALIITNSASPTINLGGGPGSVNNNVYVGNGFLDVNGYIRGKNYFYLEDGTGTLRTTLRSEPTYATLDNGSNALNYNAGSHHFLVGLSEKMRINSSGNVGIGTTSPSEKLDVSGSIKATAATDAYKGYIKNTITCTPLMKTANTSYNYIPYNSTIFSSTADYFNRMVTPYDGRVKKIILRHISGTTPTATGMKFKKEVNGTVSTTEYTATVTGGASTSFTAIYNFANSDFTFSEGDSIGILAQTSGGTGNIGGASAQIIVEYNIT